ncbi:Histone deacetylase hda1, partial [Mortierella claussenii]
MNIDPLSTTATTEAAASSKEESAAGSSAKRDGPFLQSSDTPLTLDSADEESGVTQAQQGQQSVQSTGTISDAEIHESNILTEHNPEKAVSTANESADIIGEKVSVSRLTLVSDSVTTKEEAEEGDAPSAMDVEPEALIVDLNNPRWSDDEEEQDGEERVLLPQPETILGRSTKTGYVYDVRMRFHNNVHGDDDHPEDPRRIWRIFDALNTAQCTDRMVKIASREASVEELNLVHTEAHIENITKTTVMSKDDLLEMANSYNSIYLNNSSAFCARLSCGSLIELCKAVALGHVLNGVAIIRPPGHHAEPDEAGGFCLYNNVAIAARDVHHGNGTQTAFYDDPNVVYCSIHRFDHGAFYPGDPVAAAHTAVGEGTGRGSGMGDAEYIYAFNKVIMPILYEFAPDFILVSAGFDAAKGDHIGQMLVTPAAYGHMTHMLKSLAGGKIILALEGGYNLDSIAVSGLACAKALLNDPIEALENIAPNALCVQTIHEVIEIQSRYWKSLPQVYIDPVKEVTEGRLVVDMNKLLSVYRRQYLRQRHGMIPMPRIEGVQGDEFLDNVYCTRQIYNSKPVYIFIHDLGEFCARTLGTSNVVRSDKSMLLDSVSHYVDRIVQSECELIDVVLPYQPTSEEEKVASKDKLSGLISDIWDNYVSTTGYLNRRIILLAAGFGCHGLVAFMNERQKEIVKYVSCVTMVPGDDSLPMVTKKLGNWYLENSYVMLTSDHPVWERAQKTNSRTGNLIRSDQPAGRLSELLRHMQKSIFKDIGDKLQSLLPLPIATGDDSDMEDLKDEPKHEAKNTDQDSGPDLLRNGQDDIDIKMTITSPPPPVTKEEVSLVTVLPPPVQPQQTARPHQQQQPSSSSPVIPGRKDILSRPATQTQSSSHPGSPLQNGMSISRNVGGGATQPLVDRPSVAGQQHRSQPYPIPNGRAQPHNGPAPGTMSPGSGPVHARAGTPQMRGIDAKVASEDSKQRSVTAPQQQQQQQPYQYQQHLDEQRQFDMHRQHQKRLHHQHQQQHLHQQEQEREREMYPPHPRPPPHHPQHRRSESAHLYPDPAGMEKRGPVPPTATQRAGGAAGPNEYYPTPSTAGNSAAVSPSTMTPPQHYATAKGSPHVSHTSVKTIPPQQQQPSPLQQSQQQGYGSPGPSGYRTGTGPTAPVTTSLGPSSETMHPHPQHRGPYPGQGGSGGQHPPSQQQQQQQQQQQSNPSGSFRHPGWSPQQQPPQQQQQQQISSGRMKRTEVEPDSYGGHFSQGPSASRQRQQQQQQQQEERERHMEERRRWEMDQIRQQ